MTTARRPAPSRPKPAPRVTGTGAPSAFAVALSVALAFPAALPAPARAETLEIAADEWCPYNCDPKSDRPGYMVEIAKRVFGDAGIEVRYSVMPWARALAETRAGRIAGAIGASPEEYPEAVYTAEPLGYNVTVLGMLPQTAHGFAFKSVESLAPLRIGGALNYSYDGGPIDAYLTSDAAKGKVDLLSGNELQSQNLRKLLAGRIDAVIENQNVLSLAIADIQPRPQIELVPISDTSPLYIAFSRGIGDAPRYAKLLDDGVAALRASGELAALLARYNLTDWKK